MIGERTGLPLRALALSAFVVAAAAVFVVLLDIAGGVDVGKRHRITAVVPTALQLSENADVLSAGVRVGKVEQVSNRGATAVLALALDPDRGPVHRDARVQVRAKTLVGENYVDLHPGSTGSPELPDGGELPLARARPTTQLDDVLNTMSEARQRRLGRLLRGAGTGLGDSEDVGHTVGGLSELLVSGKRLVEPLAAQREALRGLVADMGVVLRAVGERRELLGRLVRSATDTARDVGAEDAALRAGLRELPPALEQARATTARLAGVGERATPVLDDLTASLRRLTPVTRELPTAATSTLGALRRLQAASPTADRLLRALRELGDPGAALMDPLDGALRELRPTVDFLAPYARDAGGFFAGLGQSVSARDATGHVARLQPVLSAAALPLLGEAQRQAIDAVLGARLAKLVDVRGWNALPEPGTLATPQPFTGEYPRLRPDPAR
ncbi:MlaD family protein [Conexibacter sp. SYSU D00693]|uniref:MlaD family protein n=1 Tax=Conexibacter sp. SYSU D00693 TaxID=2812560 RepID=UPI00196A6C26|nr:MlaD family protein [Conexibacter sp. SYSU D00693]